MIFSGLKNGEYLIRLTVEAEEKTEVTAVTNHRRFLVRGRSMEKGEVFSDCFSVALKDADFMKQPCYRDSSVEVNVLGKCRFSAEIEKVSLPTVYCLGDSTVCDQSFGGGSELERCCGWGQTLGLFLKDKRAVSNHAEQGTHTADCLKLHIKPVLSQLKKGDVVLVQFGHNDQKQSYLTADGGYRENLIKIADAVAEKGGRCVLCTPINRLIYVDGRLNSYLDAYAAAVREICAEKGLNCIDLHRFTSESYLRLGREAEKLFYQPEGKLDRTHPNDIGGCFIGDYVGKFLNFSIDKLI